MQQKRQVCARLAGRQLCELGVHRHGMEVWVIKAQPFMAPRPVGEDVIARRVLALTDRARALQRPLWSTGFPP
jgi:hypothetical protein